MGLGGSSSSTQSVVTPKPTTVEQQSLGLSSAMIPALLQQLGYTATPTTTGKGGNATTTYSIAKAPLTPEQQATEAFRNSLTSQYQNTLLGNTIPPDVENLIGTIFNTRQDEVQRQINQAASGAAGARGMNITDTPIGEPYLRTTANAAQNLRGQQAQALLGARSEELSRAGGYMTYLDQLKNLLNFQNPLSLFGAASGFGSNLYGSRMSGTRVVGQTSTSQGWGQPVGQMLGGVGGFMGGIPGVAGSFGAGGGTMNPDYMMSTIDRGLISRGYDPRGL